MHSTVKFLAPAALIAIVFVGPLFALDCYNEVINNNNKYSGDHTKTCKEGEEYCVSFGADLPANKTFGLRACESDVKDKLEYLPAKIQISCADSASERNKTIGPVTFWYDCCKGNLCNSAATISAAMPVLATISTFFVARQLQFA